MMQSYRPTMMNRPERDLMEDVKREWPGETHALKAR